MVSIGLPDISQQPTLKCRTTVVALHFKISGKSYPQTTQNNNDATKL